jgi:hypothetical protein
VRLQSPYDAPRVIDFLHRLDLKMQSGIAHRRAADKLAPPDLCGVLKAIDTPIG